MSKAELNGVVVGNVELNEEAIEMAVAPSNRM